MMPGETILTGAKTDSHVSPFKVMSSLAGYYIGTTYRHCDKPCGAPGCEGWGCDEPNSRETAYMTKEEAEAYLPEFLLGDMTKMR